jgi:hypothetical protein
MCLTNIETQPVIHFYRLGSFIFILKNLNNSFFFKTEALREIGTKIDKSDYSILHHVTSLIYIEL